MSAQPAAARTPGWQKIISEGHMLVARLNHSKSEEPATNLGRYLLIAGIVLLSASWLFSGIAVPVAKWIGKAPELKLEAVGAAEPGTPAAARKALDAEALDKMLGGALSSGQSLIQVAEFDNASSLYAGDFKQADPAFFADFPEAGQPWPGDKILRREVGGVTFYGMRLAADYGQALWIGVRRIEDGKPVWYSLMSPSHGFMRKASGSTAVVATNIPHAINALTKSTK